MVVPNDAALTRRRMKIVRVSPCSSVAKNFVFMAAHHDAAPSPETDENQPKRFAQHIGSPRRGVFMVDKWRSYSYLRLSMGLVIAALMDW
jgi:hypothetical protein